MRLTILALIFFVTGCSDQSGCNTYVTDPQRTLGTSCPTGRVVTGVDGSSLTCSRVDVQCTFPK